MPFLFLLIYLPVNWQRPAYTSVPHPDEPRHCYCSRTCNPSYRNRCYRNQGESRYLFKIVVYLIFLFCLMNHSFVQGGCVAVAALLQYFLMVAFCWMLVEGIYLYLFVVKVYNIVDKMSIYQAFSWGKNNRQCAMFYK